MRMDLVCVHCGSDDVMEFPHAEMVFECNECGEFFEDEDELILEEIKKNRYRKQEKIMRDS